MPEYDLLTTIFGVLHITAALVPPMPTVRKVYTNLTQQHTN